MSMNHITAHGHVDAFLVDPGGRRTRVAGGPNTLLYSCADAVAAAFGGKAERQPAVIGFVYGPKKGLDAAFAFSGGDRTPRTQAELAGAGLQVYDQRIDQNRSFAAGAPEYAGNVVTFRAMKPDAGARVCVYGVVLKDAAGSVLAVKRFDECVVQNLGYAFAVSWSVTFN